MPKDAFYLVHKHADIALQLDPTIAEGHIAKAAAYLHYEWKWEKAHEALQKSIELNPTATTAYQLLAYYYVIVGQKEKAIPVMEAAINLDPLSANDPHHLGKHICFLTSDLMTPFSGRKLLAIDPMMRLIVELKAWSIGSKVRGALNYRYFLEVPYRLTITRLKWKD